MGTTSNDVPRHDSTVEIDSRCLELPVCNGEKCGGEEDCVWISSDGKSISIVGVDVPLFVFVFVPPLLFCRFCCSFFCVSTRRENEHMIVERKIRLLYRETVKSEMIYQISKKNNALVKLINSL